MRGLLPDISVDASEEEVRKDVRDVIRSCSQYDVSFCGLYDFEFIDMSGKHASVPNVKAGLKFTGKAVKNLAGSGCVYVRMTSDLFTTVISSDSSDDLPKISLQHVKKEKNASENEGNDFDSPCSSNVGVYAHSHKHLSRNICHGSLSRALTSETGREGSSSIALPTQRSTPLGSLTHTRSLPGTLAGRITQGSPSGTLSIRGLLLILPQVKVHHLVMSPVKQLKECLVVLEPKDHHHLLVRESVSCFLKVKSHLVH